MIYVVIYQAYVIIFVALNTSSLQLKIEKISKCTKRSLA